MRLSPFKTLRPSKSGLAALAAGALLATTFAALPAHAEIVGTLSCNVAPGMGAIVVSQRSLSCTYQTAGAPTELYTGSISRLGVDIGQITGGTLTYSAYVAGSAGPGALAGTYVGPGFGVTLGTGGGINALVGGNGNSITLQPLSETTSSGVNINAGIGALNLTYAGLGAPVLRHRHHRHHHHAVRHHH